MKNENLFLIKDFGPYLEELKKKHWTTIAQLFEQEKFAALKEAIDIRDFHFASSSAKGTFKQPVESDPEILKLRNNLAACIEEANKKRFFRKPLTFNHVCAYRLTKFLSKDSIREEPSNCCILSAHLYVEGEGKIYYCHSEKEKEVIEAKPGSLILMRNTGFCNENIKTRYSITVNKTIYALSFRQSVSD